MMSHFRFLVFLGLALAWATTTSAADKLAETGFLDRSLVLGGVEYRYQVYLPRAFDRALTATPTTKWPVILALHGGGDYGTDGIRQTAFMMGVALRRHAERVPAIVVFPQAHLDATDGWQGDNGRAALLALDKAISEFSGDTSRVYLTGASAGGNGAWYLASRYPQRFAAAVVICGWISEFTGKTSGIRYPPLAPEGTPDPYAAIAKQVAPLPIWIFHGDADATVPVDESRRMFAALKATGANVQYTEFPGVGHDAWNPAYERADVFEWLFKQRRP